MAYAEVWTKHYASPTLRSALFLSYIHAAAELVGKFTTKAYNLSNTSFFNFDL